MSAAKCLQNEQRGEILFNYKKLHFPNEKPQLAGRGSKSLDNFSRITKDKKEVTILDPNRKGFAAGNDTVRFFLHLVNMKLKRNTILIALSSTLLVACQQESELSKQITKLKGAEQTSAVQTLPEQITIRSLDELSAFFNRVDYSLASWQNGNRAVPRVTFDHVPKEWQHGSKSMPVNEKKEIFFKLMLPLILIANEEIAAEQQVATTASLTSLEFIKLAQKYKVVNGNDQARVINEKTRQRLLQHIGEIPPSLALAQAAEESGWATSRFTVEGNAFFGQWDFSGKGMKPKRQRKELGNYGLARFDTPLDSVRGYMLNINTGSAYKKLRQKRTELQQKNVSVTGLGLSSTLDKYSERGQAYINDINSLIRYNKLQSTDEGYLSGNTQYQLVTPK